MQLGKLSAPAQFLNQTILNKESDFERLSHPLRKISDVPMVHWCQHYIDPVDKKKVIPDGATCCWWHWVGLPIRFGLRNPAYPWQEQTFDEYFKQRLKLFYYGKPPKIGASQTWLGIALHEATQNKDWRNGQVAIVVGTGGNEAEKMIDRAKEIISYKDRNGIPIRHTRTGRVVTKLEISEDYNNKKEFSINSVEFRAHPANNVDSIRSQPNMRMIIIDEIAFFKMVEQQNVRDAFEHYIGGSDVIIVLITTAGHVPAGVAYDIETENPSIYRKHLYDYNIGLVVHPESMTSLYKKEDLDLIKDSPSWNRNYLRIWGHGSGNIFDSNLIDKCASEFYPLKDIRDFENVLSIDPAYGEIRTKTSSKFAGVGAWIENGEIYLRSWFELDNPSTDEGTARIQRELDDIGYNNIVCDGHHTGVISTFGDRHYNAYGLNYNEVGVKMVDQTEREVSDLKLHIHPTMEEIKGQMKAVRRKENGMPNKSLSRFDAGDCVSQLVWHFKGGAMAIRKLKGKF